jgi:hypothetical protein
MLSANEADALLSGQGQRGSYQASGTGLRMPSVTRRKPYFVSIFALLPTGTTLRQWTWIALCLVKVGPCQGLYLLSRTVENVFLKTASQVAARML